ncbi:AAA family ATPase [Candidatus Parcubacteria bacterium]|jgi:hypothetical protein|nr:AAA family ATPase [Candidatus Parcubacteria bacterium]
MSELPFLTSLRRAYNNRRKNVTLLTGNVLDMFWHEPSGRFLRLEQKLYQELAANFNLVRLDTATGVSFYDKVDQENMMMLCESKDDGNVTDARKRSFQRMLGQTVNSPLAALTAIKGMSDSTVRFRRIDKEVKPLCLIVQYSGSLFPRGDFDRLSEIDRQRLVFFLNWIGDPLFADSSALIILISDTRSEVNSKILALPATEHIEVELPESAQRQLCADKTIAGHSSIQLESGLSRFVEDTAGLTLSSIRDLMLSSEATGDPVTRSQVVAEVNTILEAKMSTAINIKYPHHTPTDVVGHKGTGEIFRSVFERCEDPETAISAILVSGPNGGGKSFQLEAYACASGRVVIELANIRSSDFGGTDKLFELLRSNIAVLGKVLILVDEAHTAFGSVHDADAHATEKRLAGNIIKMMGDPRYFGKVLWGMMTSRPDELDPDIKSRSPIQIPIFDLEGDERRDFVAEMFARKKLTLGDDEVADVLEQTKHYSARDYRDLIKEMLASRKAHQDITIAEVLQNWQASKSIVQQREFQALVAALHCSYPQLLPTKYRDMESGAIRQRIEELKWALHK